MGEVGARSDYLNKYLMPSALLYLGQSFSGLACTGALLNLLPTAYFALRQLLEGIALSVYADILPDYEGLNISDKD